MLSELQKQIATELSTGESTMVEIAQKHEITRQTIHNWKGNPEFAAFLDELTKIASEFTRQQFRASAAKAYKTLHLLLESKSEKVQLEAAKAILDRAGFAVETINRIEMQQPEQKQTKLTVEQIRERLKQSTGKVGLTDGQSQN